MPRLHRASIVGRARCDAGLLVLMALVVMLATVLTSAVAPLSERTADRAVAADVRAAGLQGAVVATIPRPYEDGPQLRDPEAAAKLRQSADSAQHDMPAGLAAVVRPGVISLTSPPMHLLDAGPGRYLRLAYVTGPGAAPDVRYVSGRAPRAGVPAAKADRQVAVTPIRGPCRSPCRGRRRTRSAWRPATGWRPRTSSTARPWW